MAEKITKDTIVTDEKSCTVMESSDVESAFAADDTKMPEAVMLSRIMSTVSDEIAGEIADKKGKG